MNTEKAEILVANTSCVFEVDGQIFRIFKGKTTARRGNKLIRGREHLFTPLVIDFDVPVVAEQRRGPGRPRKNPVVTDQAVIVA